MNYQFAGMSVLFLGIAGCSSLPERIDTLEQARTSVQSLENDPLVRDVAQRQFENATAALRIADEAYEEREPLELIEHNAYVALRNAQIAEQMIAEERAREELEKGEVERTRVQLQAREQEAQARERDAAQAEARAEEAQALAEQRAAEVELQASAAEEARQSAAQLEQELASLQAEQTERGLVLTLDDVLFDTNRAVLKPGADSTMQRLAQFLDEYPERRIMIEGHTDATGSDEYNRQLSAQRADAVRSALVGRNISSARIETHGLGESYPIASNDTDAGRQLNRRVEIIVSDEQGTFPAAAARSSSGG